MSSQTGLKRPSSKLYESLKKLAERPKEMERSLSSMKKVRVDDSSLSTQQPSIEQATTSKAKGKSFKNLPHHRKLQQGNNMLAKLSSPSSSRRQGPRQSKRGARSQLHREVSKSGHLNDEREKLLGLNAKPCNKSKGLQFDLEGTQKELNMLKVELLQALETCAELKADVVRLGGDLKVGEVKAWEMLVNLLELVWKNNRDLDYSFLNKDYVPEVVRFKLEADGNTLPEDPSNELKDVLVNDIKTSTAAEVIADKLKTGPIVKVTHVNEAADEQLAPRDYFVPTLPTPLKA
ncbi:hypothetical protein Pint_25178 [Pistacia integerrima]|uniref:Uncharacterized protein n=1 Tax=Pistacia integerrima TaxID=434235 RepID=A0ACC0YE48_9ROSI|nr:hypothetical protein Pint_25178 [Pistacia integerrima]